MAQQIDADDTTVVSTRGAASAPGERLTPGTIVGGYEIEEFVAYGGFATVYRARSQSTGELVALKLMRAELVPTGTPAQRFQREAETLARIVHPSIVQVIEAGQVEAGVPFLVMEWVTGRTLLDELRARGVFSPDELLGLMEELCGALSAVHAVGVVHRDLKLSNVMVIQEGDWIRLKVLDFGIVKLLEPAQPDEPRSALTTTGTMLGTPGYMAPEQYLGRPVDARTDVYALGVMSYVLLTGRHPFVGRTSTEITEMQLTGTPPRLSELLPVPQGVDDAIHKCIEKRPIDRYQSMEAFLDDLRRSVRGAGASPNSAPSGGEKATTLSVGVYVAVACSGAEEDIDDETFSQLDACLERSLELLTQAGMLVSLSTGNAFMATVDVTGARAAGAERAAVIRRSLDVRRILEALLGPTPSVRVSLVVHAAESRAHLQAGGWMTRNPWDTVVATSGALAGIEGQFALRDVPGVGDRRVVERALGAST